MRIATDIGGTFTDLVAVDETGKLVLEKAHTTPPNFEEGVMDVLKKSGIDPKSVEAFFPWNNHDYQCSDRTEGS